jgi:hypothetical protein
VSSPRAYRVQIRGGLPAGLREEMHSRFQVDAVEVQPDGGVMITGSFDQSGLRAFLEFIWDVGGTTVSVVTESNDVVPIETLTRKGEDNVN